MTSPQEKGWSESLIIALPGQKHCTFAFSLLQEEYFHALCDPSWEGRCYRLNLPNSHAETLTLTETIFGDRAFMEVIKCWLRSYRWDTEPVGLVTLEEITTISLPFLAHMCMGGRLSEDMRKQKTALARSWIGQDIDLGLLTSRTMRGKNISVV